MTTQGSMVQAGDELLSLIDPSTLELEAGLPVTLASAARPGTPVTLRVVGWSGSTVTANIVRVAPALDPVTRQLRVTVRVPNGTHRLPAGAWAEGSLVSPTAAENAPLIGGR
jgi:multidrug efflux pump subunit AcrA (membrane-fusion protein)